MVDRQREIEELRRCAFSRIHPNAPVQQSGPARNWISRIGLLERNMKSLSELINLELPGIFQIPEELLGKVLDGVD